MVLAMSAKARDMIKVHRMLAHPREEITQKTTAAMRIAMTDQWESCEARLQMTVKPQAVQ